MAEIKKMRFWGTSAGEGTPSPFCRCKICEYAREHGGKDIRTRSSFRIDEKVMIDAGADFVAQAQKYNEDTFDIEHILYTHTHSDHYNFTVPWLHLAAVGENKNPLNLYFSEAGEKFAEELIKYIGEPYNEKAKFHILKYGETYKIDKYEVTPLKGNHHTPAEPNSINYLIKLPDGRYMYYGVDSAYYLDETFDFLKNYKIDILVSECTFPREEPDEDVHMNYSSLKKTFERLENQGTINSDTTVYLTHICGKGMNHDDIEKYWESAKLNFKVVVAYDGLVME